MNEVKIQKTHGLYIKLMRGEWEGRRGKGGGRREEGGGGELSVYWRKIRCSL